MTPSFDAAAAADKLKTFLGDKSCVLISTHRNPDGDGLGSEIALAEYLQQIGIEPIIVNPDPTPQIYEFLDPNREISIYSKDAFEALDQQLDGVILVDVNEPHRLDDLGKRLQELQLPIAVIDHHPNGNTEGVCAILDPAAASTGEILFELLVAAGAAISLPMAEALYTCILTDTGAFRFNNTTPRTHRIAARLLEMGVRARDIYSTIYESYSKQRAWLKGELLASLRFEVDDRLCWFVLSREILNKTGAALQDAEGFAELPNIIRSVEMSLLFTETEDGVTKVGFRSKGRVPVRPLAEQYGGGGHLYASGAVLPMKLEEAIRTLVPKAVSFLQQHLAGCG